VLFRSVDTPLFRQVSESPSQENAPALDLFAKSNLQQCSAQPTLRLGQFAI
jgi:hypothetical protein